MQSSLILIIDDDASIRHVAGEILATEGFRIAEGINVASGIAQAQLQRPDLILCDVMMPDGNGFDVLSTLQKIPELSSVPFIFMSGEAIMAQDIRRGMTSGADDYLVKPFKVQELVASVRARLARQLRIVETAQVLMSEEPLPPFFAGAKSDLLKKLHQTSANFCLLALRLERYERFIHVFGKNQSQHLVYTAIYRLSKLESLKEVLFYMSDEPDKVYLLYPHQNLPALIPQLEPLLRSFSEPLAFDRFQLRLLGSLGLCCSAAEPLDYPDKMLNMADIALYHARAQGGNTYVIYQPQMDQHVHERLRWEDELQLALNEQRFELYYQPQIDLERNKVVAMEALLRLKHPDFGMIPPGDFIPVAEDSGLIVPIGSWVLQQACQMLKKLHHLGFGELRMAVNVSLLQFQDSRFVEQVSQVIQETGIEGQHLELELTESLLIENFSQLQELLFNLKSTGLSLAIDDFGTGYSSLFYLSKLPFDLLKIDQSFVRTMGENRNTQAIPRAIVEMGHGMEMRVLAEGIETPKQFEILHELGCDYGQGYHIARPLPEADLLTFLQHRMEM